MTMGPTHRLSAVITLVVLLYFGVKSGKDVKDTSVFQGGSRAPTLLVMGGLLGTMIGGSATIGTAQMAFTDGLSAVWFSFGCALGCVLLLIVGPPFQRSGRRTVTGLIRQEYGERLGVLTTGLASFGMFVNIAGQMVAATALLGSVLNLSVFWSVLISILSMSAYVIFGGLKGASILGLLKTLFLYVALVASSGIILVETGGEVNLFSEAVGDGYGLFHRGVGIDVGSALGVMLGLATTQTYFQVVFSARDYKTAKSAILISILLLPPVGFMCAQIGLYMKSLYPTLSPAYALTSFVLEHFPGVPAGMFIALLFFALLGTGSGMALGLSTNLVQDIYMPYVKKSKDGEGSLLLNRGLLLLILICAGLMTMLSSQTAILSWGFLSLGLRGMVLFTPVLGALFYKGKYSTQRIILGATLPFVVYVLFHLFVDLPFDPVFLGLITGLVILLIPRFKGQKHP